MKSVDIVVAVFTARDDALRILLVRRPGTVWALPSGEAETDRTVEQAARDELADQTGIAAIPLEQLYTFDRDDGARLTVAYIASIPPDRHAVTPGGEAVEVRWFPVDDRPPLIDHHDEVADAARRRVRAKAAYAPIAFEMLPGTFTLSELQAVYEAVLGAPLDPRNFRRDVIAGGAVEAVGRQRRTGPGRPAQLFRATGTPFAVDPEERRASRLIATVGEADEDG